MIHRSPHRLCAGIWHVVSVDEKQESWVTVMTWIRHVHVEQNPENRFRNNICFLLFFKSQRIYYCIGAGQ